jgi:hypothetical protein
MVSSNEFRRCLCRQYLVMRQTEFALVALISGITNEIYRKS